jgi:hypothetical protein
MEGRNAFRVAKKDRFSSAGICSAQGEVPLLSNPLSLLMGAGHDQMLAQQSI